MSTEAFQDLFRGSGEFEPVAAPLYGLRQWRRRHYAEAATGRARLTSTFLQAEWSPGVNVADCHAATMAAVLRRCIGGLGPARPAHDDVPHPACQCGFWAYSPPAGQPAVLQDFAAPTVVGVIEAWGRAVVGTHGFRAEKARIVALAFPSPSSTDPDVVTSAAYALQHKLAPVLEACCPDDHDHGPPTGHWEVNDPEQQAALAAAYPAAAQFPTIEQMLAEFPLTDLAALAAAS